ncbi:hypothetical protein JZ751_003591 [Albula glossodonta]|uniref:PHD finger protein 3 n=1 Tax=Albula glossodonta TaxID=121402 RepID=A0A8T2N7B4_9TELE|nr:hypothetical protein JZ751_003591 [Albula glossodonta]
MAWGGWPSHQDMRSVWPRGVGAIRGAGGPLRAVAVWFEGGEGPAVPLLWPGLGLGHMQRLLGDAGVCMGCFIPDPLPVPLFPRLVPLTGISLLGVSGSQGVGRVLGIKTCKTDISSSRMTLSKTSSSATWSSGKWKSCSACRCLTVLLPPSCCMLLLIWNKSPELSRPPLVSRTLPPATAQDRLKDQCPELQPGVSRSAEPHIVPRSQIQHTAVSGPSNAPAECSAAEEREKGKMKKTDRTLQRQRSRSGRSLSLEEPPLFIPDNAPAVKQETNEEDRVSSETVWDPTKHCVLCKKPHNNRFMVGCGRCDDWFHGECVGLNLAKAQQMEQEDQEYVCLKCCAEEDRKSSVQRPSPTEGPSEPEHSLDSKPVVKQTKPHAAGVRTDRAILFKRVLKGEISPDSLIRMSPEELASKELAAWRKRENRHTIEMIEKEQREAERRPITKITHKGEIEIENQEPVKEPEAMEVESVQLEPVPKVEEPAEVPQRQESDSTKDTTSQHKDHLFDLDCKICTVQDAATKVMKVATTVMWRQAGSDGAAPSSAMSTQPDGQPLSGAEESSVTPKAFSTEGRSDCKEEGENETVFLARVQSLWNGFINMPAVAKLVTKAYPVSGILEHLSEALPDSIQVGGRISPQTVWDYVEKIRASGTKEICLIRFHPVTEEDEISYTLLYAYFSSRKRYGVVANNMKQVKDMYLIPLGSSEKIPHHLVPFDGPGLEAKRSNLLLGLIIRQRVKRDFEVSLPVDVPETNTVRCSPNTKSYSTTDDGGTQSEDVDFFSSLKIVRPKQVVKGRQSTENEVAELPVKRTTLAMDASQQDPAKPLRFLPGVLSSSALGFDSDLHCRSECAEEKEAGRRVTAGEGSSVGNKTSSNLLERFIVKKKDPKTFQMDVEKFRRSNKSNSTNTSDKEAVNMTDNVRDNPEDSYPEPSVSASVTRSGNVLDNPVVKRKEGSLGEHSRLRPEWHHNFGAGSDSPAEDVFSAVSESSGNDSSCSRAPAHEGYTIPPQMCLETSGEILGNSSAKLCHDRTDHNLSNPGLIPASPASVFPGGDEAPQCMYPPGHAVAPMLPHHAGAPPGFPVQSSSVPAFHPPHQHVPHSVRYPSAVPSMLPQPEVLGQSVESWPRPGPPSAGLLPFAQSSMPPLLTGHQGAELLYHSPRDSRRRHSEGGYRQESHTSHGVMGFHSKSHEWKAP